MALGATTASCVSGSASPSEAHRSGRLPRWWRAAPLLLIALLLPLGAAQTATTLLQRGDYQAAYEKAAPVETAAMQLVAARAATDQVVYRMAPAGATLDDELVWLRRAVSAAESAVRLDPESAPALVALARGKGEIARRSGVLQNLNVAGELKSLFDRALELEPDNADALVGLAMWHLELVRNGVGWIYGGRESEILPLLERGVAAAPEQPNLRVEYATALRALGREAEAVEQLELALELPARSASDEAEQRRAREMLP